MPDFPPKLWIPQKPAIIRPAPPELVPPALALTMLARMSMVRAKRNSAGSGKYSNLTFRGALPITTPGTSFAFGSQPIGATAPNRYVILVPALFATSGFPTVTDVSVGGNSTDNTVGAASFSGVGVNMFAGFYWRNVTSATSATITVTTSSTCAACHIGYWTVNMSASENHSQNHGNVTTGECILNASVPAGGFSLAVSLNGTTSDLTETMDLSYVKDQELFAGYNSAFSHLESAGGLNTDATVEWGSGFGGVNLISFAGDGS